MPPRLNKRQQREQEELQALNGLSKPPESSSEDEKPVNKPANTGFAALFTPGDEPTDEDETPVSSQKSRKKKKKKAAGSVAETSRSETPAAPTPPRATPVAPKNEKKAAKKAKARERKAEKEEFDQALAELSIKYPELQNAINYNRETTRPSSSSLTSLLSVSVANLDSEAEMRKFFGSKVVQANKSNVAGPSRRTTTQRSQLTRPPAVWFRTAPREGLSLRLLTNEELSSKSAKHAWDPASDEKWWTVEYSKKYKSVTLAFMTVVYSGDPNGFYNLLQQFPWHGDTLLQLAEVYRHREEYSNAVEYVDRALFSYERAFFGSFNFATGLNRLDFDHIENRPFFLALHRQTTDLQRRGCVRTAFEFARLLLSLDPENDPHGALLHLDFLAVKTSMTEWLVEMFDFYATCRASSQTKDARVDPSLLPGWSYARALALRKGKNPDAGTKALVEAIRSFPTIVPVLADKLDISLPNSIRGHSDFKIETDAKSLRNPEGTLHLLSHLYAQRSAPLWKDESVWFRDTVTTEFASLPASLPVLPRRQDFLSLYHNQNLRYSVYRHVMVLESTHKRLFAYIPADVLNVKSLQCDPLPPPTAITSYDNAFFEGVEDLRTFAPPRRRAHQERILAQMIPNAAFRQQLQAFWEAMPAVQEQFPGGIVHFAQAAAQMDPEALEAIMMAAAVGDAGEVPVELPPGGAGMPGEMPGLGGAWEDPEEQEEVPEEVIDEQDEEESDEDEVAPLPLRVLRNVLGRFWGGNTAPDDSSSDDEERQPLDPAGVD
ncbi:hypothetical protein MIND_01319200 [Mycena indigotica]|uniref:Transcription factor 25 n=1 Tax=Mycena indigotica TaxID=2126181 RepID=A0A8H6S1V3_9AGAR|nr:uncharacterized protein MIND_01319200 [Mycena indigotica]KAF7290783.1 hypothetical protein MIND_01319200 [Mycena indigotica]